MEIERMRAKASDALGDAFSLRAFHDAVHARGAVPLTILRENLNTWIATMTEETTQLPDFRELWDFQNPAATEQKFREVLARDATAEHPTYRKQLVTQIARTYSLRSMFEEAHQELDAIEAELDEVEPVVEVRYLLERGRTYNSAKKADEARPLFERAWDVARRARLDGLAVDAAHMMGIVERGDASIEWNEKAMAYAEASDDPAAKRWLGALYNNMGWTYHDAGKYERALELFEKGYEWRKERDDEEATLVALWSVGRAMRSLERHDHALKLQLRVLERRDELESPDGFVHEELGELYLQRGNREKAREHFALAFELLKKFDWVEDDRLERIERLASE